MTTMDRTDPFAGFTDDELVRAKTLRDHVKRGGSYDQIDDAGLLLLKRVRDAGAGATGNTTTGPDTAALAAGLESSRAYGGQGVRDLAAMFPNGQAPAAVNPEPWRAADPTLGFNRPGGAGLSPEERMVGVQPNFEGMAPAVRSSVEAYYHNTGNTDRPADQIPADWARQGQQIAPTAPSGLSPEQLAVQQQRVIRDMEVQRYAEAMGGQGGGVVESAVRAPVHAVNSTLRGLLGMVDLQGNPALTEAVGRATEARPEGLAARVVSGATGMVPVLTVGAMGGTPMMLGAMGLQSFDDAFHAYQADLQRKGDLNATGKALAAAAAVAPLETALNAIPAHRFLGALERASPGFGAFLRARAIDAATNAGIGAAADVTRQAGGVASGAQDQLDLRQTLAAIPEQAAVGGLVGAGAEAGNIGARGDRMGQVRDLRQAQADARATGGVPEQAGAYQPRPANPWEQTKAAPRAPIGRGDTTTQVPDGAGPPARPASNERPAPPENVTKSAENVADARPTNVRPASGEYTLRDLGRSTEAARGTGGISSEVRDQGLVPAFRDRETGKVYPSKYPPGWANKGDPARPAGVHIMDGLPDEVVVTRDVTDPQTVLAVKPSIEPGFTDNAGKFYTREEAAAHKAKADPYPRARAILDEIGVPDAGEVAVRLGLTLPEADRLVSRWESDAAAGRDGTRPNAQTEASSQPSPAHELPANQSTPDSPPSPESSRGPSASLGRPDSSSPNSTRPALGSSRLGIPLDVVSEATRQREAAAENIARQSRPFAPPGRAVETERRSVLNRFRNPDTAGYSMEGSLTPEGVFADAEARAARRTPPVPDKSASPAAADAVRESGRRAADTAPPVSEASRSSGEGTRLSKLADKLGAAAEKLKAGPGVRQGKGGRGTRAGASDLHKVAGYAAMKAAEGAIRLADTVQGYAEKGIRITREMAEDAIRRFKGSHDPAEVMRVGNRMIRAATNKDGTIDPHKLELVRAEAISRAVDEAPEPTQPQRDRQQQKAVNTAAAIERGKGQDSAAVREGMALRAATAKGKLKLSEQAEVHREAMQAQREAFADKLDELRAQKAVGLDVRREIVKLAKEKLDPADRFRIMDFLAGADFKNPTAKKADVTRDILAGVTRILHIADTAAERRSKAELRAIVGKAARPSTGPKLAGEVNADLGVKGEKSKLAKGTVNARDVAQLRTPVRDALTEVVDSLRNDHTTGAGKLADFLEKQGTAEADMSVGVSDYFSAEELARIKALDNKLSDDLTPDERTLLGNAIKHAAHLSAEGDKFQVGSEKRAFGEVKAKTIEEVKTRGKEAANPQRAIEGGAGKLLQGAKELVTTDQMDLSRMLGTVAGTDSTLHDTAYKALADGESAQKLLVREAMDKSGLKDWKAKDIARANQRRTVKLSSGVQKLRGWEMMEILGHYMDPSTQHEIEQAPFLREADKGKHKDRGFFATREDLATIESMLTAKERALVPKLHDALKLVYREANDAHEDLLGFRLPDQPFHWSRVRDRTKVNEGLDARVARQTRFEDSPMYKERTGSKEPIVLRNPFEWVPEAIHQHAGMAKLARPMRNVRRLLNDPEVRSALTTAGGDNFLTKAEGRIAELVPAPGAGDGTAINRIMQGLLGRYASAKLAFRISSVAKQRLGLFQAASVADDPKLAARLSAEAFKPLPILPAEANRLRAEINPRSGYLSERADPAFAATLQSAANPHLKVATTAVGQAWNAVERVGLSGLQAADSGVVLRTYRSVKAHLEGQGFMGGELLDRAVRQTEHIIRDSQNPTSPLDMSGLNLAGRKNPWLGAALMFTSSANKMRNVLVQTISDTRADPSAKNLGKLAKVTALTGANAIAEYGIGLATGGAAIGAIASWASGGDDERKKVGMAQKVLANLADVVQPGAGDVIRTIQSPDQSGTAIGKAITAARTVMKAADDETMRGSDKAVRIINAARALLPLVPDAPLDYAQNIIRGVAGSEMTNQTGGIKAALQRGDEKSLEQARERIEKYVAAQVAKPAKEFTEAEDPEDKAQRIREGLRSRLLKMSGTRFDKLSQEQQDTLEGMDNPPDWYAAERAKYDEWAAKVEKLLPE